MAMRLEGRAGPVPDAELASSRWRTLYRLGGAAFQVAYLLEVWYVLVARRLLQLGQGVSTVEVDR